MSNKSRTTLALAALTLVLGACTDEDQLASTDQEMTTLDDCATGDNPNAFTSISTTDDSYTRTANTINNVCGCKGWQQVAVDSGQDAADQQFPDCRHGTLVKFSLSGQQLGFLLGAEVSNWGVSNQTDCLNSDLTVKLQQWNGTSFTTVWQNTEVPTTWNGTSCSPRNYYSPQGLAMSGTYYLRATARRGTPASNNGYATVLVRGRPY
jgi:hypothetical protein